MRSEKVSKKRAKPYNNRVLYSLVAVAIIVALAVGIYAGAYIVPGANPKTPNPGHNISQIQTCGAGQIIQTNSTGNGWRCVDLPSSSLTRGSAFYQVSNQYCTTNVGTFTLEAQCHTGYVHNFYCYAQNCDGSLNTTIYQSYNNGCPSSSPITCDNQLIGYFVS